MHACRPGTALPWPIFTDLLCATGKFTAVPTGRLSPPPYRASFQRLLSLWTPLKWTSCPPSSAYSHPPRPPSYLFPAPLNANNIRPFLPIARNSTSNPPSPFYFRHSHSLLLPFFSRLFFFFSFFSLCLITSPSSFVAPNPVAGVAARTQRRRRKKRPPKPQRRPTRPSPTDALLCYDLVHAQPGLWPSPAPPLDSFATVLVSHSKAALSDEPFYSTL